MTAKPDVGATMPALRLCVIVATLGGGGAERVVIELTRSWVRSGHEVTIATLLPAIRDEYEIPPGVERREIDLARVSRHIFDTLRNTAARDRAVRAFISSTNPDVVVSFIDTTNVRVVRSLRRSDIPVVISEETDPTAHPLGWRWRILRRVFYPRAQALVVHAEGIRAWANRVMLRRSRVHVLPNAVWLDVQSPAPRDPDARQVVLGMGRLAHVKGFDVLLRAFAELAPRAPTWDLVICGEGSERAALGTLARELGIIDRVRLPGRTDDPASVYAAADVFALPSRTESFPLALVEAMATGLAVVASALPSGPADVVDDGVNGLLVPPDDVAALSDALYRLITDADLRIRLGTMGREARDRYAPHVVATQWEHVLREVSPSTRSA